MLKLSYDAKQRIYILQATKYMDRVAFNDFTAQAREAGFRFDKLLRAWVSFSNEHAAKFAKWADTAGLKAELASIVQKQTAILESSRAMDSDIEIPVPKGIDPNTGKPFAYRNFQKAAIAFAMARTAAYKFVTLEGDPPGAGKTIITAGLINLLEAEIESVLIIPPASLKINWARELSKWLVKHYSIGIVGKDGWPDTQIVICNYEQLKKYHDEIRKKVWSLVVGDECHYLKSTKAQRTQQVFGRRAYKDKPAITPIPAKRSMFLTGTPMPNRPIEMYPLVSHARVLGVNSNYQYYTNRYCAAHHNGWGWDVSGASNLEELQQKLRSTIMIRREKSEIMPELPPIQEQLIEVPANGNQGLVDRENAAYNSKNADIEELRSQAELAKLLGTDDDIKAITKRLRDRIAAAFSEMSALRKEAGIAKIPHAVEYAKDKLEEYEKIVVFAHHHEVIDALIDGLSEFHAVRVDGRMSDVKKQASIDAFQKDPKVRVIVMGLMVAMGHTLTASNYELIVEQDWVPGVIEQVIGRVHRMGQQKDSVLIQYLALEGSLDARMAQKRLNKEENAHLALDKRPDPVVEMETPITKQVTREEIEEKAITLTPQEIADIHARLRYLAGMDMDHASHINGIGFNRFDGKIGHSLAESETLSPKQAALGQKILIKYRRQLQGAGLLPLTK